MSEQNAKPAVRVHPRCAGNHRFQQGRAGTRRGQPPGVMSHICNLFARRAFNVEGILCMPVGSRRDQPHLAAGVRGPAPREDDPQVEKLEDVRYVQRHAGDHPVFGASTSSSSKPSARAPSAGGGGAADCRTCGRRRRPFSPVSHPSRSPMSGNTSASCSASPPSANPTARPSAAWWMAARRAGDQRGRHPGRARPAQARHLPPRHPAPGQPTASRSCRGVRGRHHRHADRAADPQPGPALQGLRQHRRDPPGPRRLRLLAEIRHPRPPRRRPPSARETAVRGRAGASPASGSSSATAS